MSGDKSHPPVPPSEHRRVPELDGEHGGARVVEHDRNVATCPGCDGRIDYFEVETGEVMMAFWDPDEFDGDEFQLSETYERRERYQECQRCGWRVDV